MRRPRVGLYCPVVGYAVLEVIRLQVCNTRRLGRSARKKVQQFATPRVIRSMLEHFPTESAVTEPKAAAFVLDDFVSEADLPRPRAAVPVVGVDRTSSTARPQLSFVSAALLGVLFGTIIAFQFIHRPASGQVSAPRSAGITEAAADTMARATPRATAELPVPSLPPSTAESAQVAIDAPKSPSERAIEKPAVLIGPVMAPASVPPSPPLVLQPLGDVPRVDPVMQSQTPIQSATPEPSTLTVAALPSTVEPPRAAPAVASQPPVNVVFPQAESASAASVAAADDRSLIENVLSRYGSAYSDLDARAVKQVWPTATESALAKAFAGLEYQNLGFYECDTTIAGATARATCDGQVSYVGRVGPKQPRTENREWVFTLKKSDGLWQIERVQVR